LKEDFLKKRSKKKKGILLDVGGESVPLPLRQRGKGGIFPPCPA